ncbi:MAG: HYR domain-containing protein, partial [Verrucomicrobiota bacterium]
MKTMGMDMLKRIGAALALGLLFRLGADAGEIVVVLDVYEQPKSVVNGSGTRSSGGGGYSQVSSGAQPGGIMRLQSGTNIQQQAGFLSAVACLDDRQAPGFISCPSNVNAVADAGVCETFVTIGMPVVLDNCDLSGVSVTNDFNGGTDASDTYPTGITRVVWYAADMAGNVSTCSLVVTVVDNEAPVLTCPSNITVNVDPGTCTVTVVVNRPPATDNCTAMPTVVNDYTGLDHLSNRFALGTTVVEWVAVDMAGNSVTCDQQVVVRDLEPPLIFCPPSISTNTDFGTCTVSIAIGPPLIVDNCATNLVATNDYNNTSDAGGIYPTGLTFVTWSVPGPSNPVVCTQVVFVLDNEAPMLLCGGLEFGTTDGEGCFASLSPQMPDVTDNCDPGVSFINDYNGTADADDFYPAGETVIEWTATDSAGNMASCFQTVLVVDADSPFIDNCPT